MSFIRPTDDILKEPFWQGLNQGRLMLQRCPDCAEYRHPPQPICWNCHAFSDVWVESRGEGIVYSFTIVTHPVHEVLADKVPYVIGMIELTEKVRMVANIKGIAPQDVRVGMAVSCSIEKVGPDFCLPVFYPRPAP